MQHDRTENCYFTSCLARKLEKWDFDKYAIF